MTHKETYFKVSLIHIQFYYLVKTDANLHAEMGMLFLHEGLNRDGMLNTNRHRACLMFFTAD